VSFQRLSFLSLALPIREFFQPFTQPLRQIVIFFIRIVKPDVQSSLAAGQTMTPSRPFDYDLRHIFTHKYPLFRLKPFGRLFNLQDSQD
jgi:hypothetical protein